MRSKLTGHVRIGCLDNTVTLKNNPLPKAIEAFHKLSDSVEVTLEVADFTQLNEKLAKNQLDMMIVVLADNQRKNFDYVTALFEEESYLYARNDLADKIQKNNFSLENQRINIGTYSLEIMYQLLDIEKINNIKLYDGWHVESGLLLVLAGTHLSFLPTHLIENNQFQQQVVALQPKKWHFKSQFSLVLKNHQRSLSPAALAFHNCLMNLQNG